jgi:hypothetical protein
MTNTRKTTATIPSEPETTPATATKPDSTPPPTPEPVLGPPLRPGQEPERVTFAHHLRIEGRDYRPGDRALLSPEYARQLRSSGYLARGRS